MHITRVLVVITLVFLPRGYYVDAAKDEAEEDYYKLLGIEKNADSVEIRRAFKKIAVIKHPDKNQDDPDAHENFLKIAEAYEILKDPKKRSDYDMYGKAKFQNRSPPQYHSYTYYRDQFGIYDDDPLVVTLTSYDFESSVGDGVWFINFYSAMCSHCHHLAPAWRQVAKDLQGVIKIGAVNCGDERQLCWDVNIKQFPTLLFYGENSKAFDGEEYIAGKELQYMKKFIMTKLASSFSIPVIEEVPTQKILPNLFFMCYPDSPCMEKDNMIKLSAVLKGLVLPAKIVDPNLIERISGKKESGLLYMDQNEESSHLFGDDFLELADGVLGLLPEVPILDTEGFQNARTQLRSHSTMPWLLCFTLGMDTEKTIILKKLTATLNNFNIGEINCARSSELCKALHIVKYPTWGILKKGGAFEVHSGRTSLHAVERFARDSEAASNLHALSPQDLKNIMKEGTPWMIGWLLHGCPPCKKMLPALRKASLNFEPKVVQFGTVDCAQHSHVCSQYGIYQYPTTILYNETNKLTYKGQSSEEDIVEFINMIKNTHVISLTKDNFYDELGKKDVETIYIVEYYAPWCSPCQMLQPEWRKLAKKLSYTKNVRVGAVNCENDKNICSEQSIRAYPTIRLYPAGSEGMNSFALYTGERTASAIHYWMLGFIESPLVQLFADNYKPQLLSKNENRTWVVMFFAPWCQYCHEFEPEFITATQRLEDLVIGGKVDCVKDQALCRNENIQSYPTVKLFQRKNGVTKIPGELKLSTSNEDTLYKQIKKLVPNVFVNPMKHDEL